MSCESHVLAIAWQDNKHTLLKEFGLVSIRCQADFLPLHVPIEVKEIDFIQVIGHTDGQGITQAGNLDRQIEQVARGEQAVKQLKPGSNADLGLMRALAVVQAIQKTKDLENVEFRAYSAGQLYLPSGKVAQIDRQANPNRRRIEIRFIPPGQNQ